MKDLILNLGSGMVVLKMGVFQALTFVRNELRVCLERFKSQPPTCHGEARLLVPSSRTAQHVSLCCQQKGFCGIKAKMQKAVKCLGIFPNAGLLLFLSVLGVLFVSSGQLSI